MFEIMLNVEIQFTCSEHNLPLYCNKFSYMMFEIEPETQDACKMINNVLELVKLVLP